MIAAFQRSLAPLVRFGAKPLVARQKWRVFFVSGVIPVGHVRWHAPSFHACLPQNYIHSAAKNSRKYEGFNL
jgi:hypothetical protein